MSRQSPISHRHPATLTHVELTWIDRRIEHWLRFGHCSDEHILDDRRRISSFAPGSVFAFVRWASNDLGITVSRLDIVRAVRAGEVFQTLPFVRPGGEILLRVDSWPRVEHVLRAVDAIEALGLDPADAAPEYWRHLHHRITAGHEPRAYTRAQHSAWLKRRQVTS
ncbi:MULTISPECIES: DUF2840 domain-containing protein [Acetobacter]|uniref:Glycosidase n=1 Tax=Acetobacter fabarum TaxID=483199 RepID=A0A269XXB5_9PROT|nr:MULTISPECIES: DUF2840 domain-containing protein [Acetobacter]PAK77086.1 glycosidase [Acetobacter fabarum]PEN23305.1 DUF2840 domain-containing protein [Acetobacter fabarum]GCD57085.1 hypothetical protein NBRC3222_2422 [Acetobacter pasteurianus NBRC 3222]